MAGVIAGGFDDGRGAELGHRQEGVWVTRGADGVDGDFDASARSVFKADGHTEAGGQLAVDLALRCARADGAPRDDVGHVLRCDDIEEFGARGNTFGGEVEQQLAGDAQAFVDVVGFVDVGVIDQALPSDGGAWFFKIHAHDDLQVVFVAVDLVAQAFAVFQRCVYIVDGAGSNDHKEAIVFAVDDLGGLLTVGGHQLRTRFWKRKFFQKNGGRDERSELLDADIVRIVLHTIVMSKREAWVVGPRKHCEGPRECPKERVKASICP